MDTPAHTAVRALAAACAAQLPPAPRSFATDLPAFAQPFRDLTEAVARLEPRFAFDRQGRPSAIAAIRSALPATERDLLDAVIEDHACELAAVQEAMYQLALAHGKPK